MIRQENSPEHFNARLRIRAVVGRVGNDESFMLFAVIFTAVIGKNVLLIEPSPR